MFALICRCNTEEEAAEEDARSQRRLAAQRAQLARVLSEMIAQPGHKRTLFGKRLDSPAAIFNAIDRDKNRTRPSILRVRLKIISNL